ncbi:MAG: glycosyltransferase family 2 protein [Planctomycetaceae bacterium]|jgi:glycosyltransferase involved in cell wall biosynthesis|nr:glycosyltransferase family 2 protein [Planctomycetaceae bacterium]
MTSHHLSHHARRIAVLLPCYNEAASIANVVAAFKAALPAANIYVYDNNSKDGTAEMARRAGAVVCREINQGKGNVVRRMFNDIEADIYVMADGDETYDPAAAPGLISKLVEENLDMVVGSRVETDVKAYRSGHRFGNRMLTGLVKYLFGYGFEDILSGYRVMSRRFVKSFPIHSGGFEIETEMSVHALQLQLPVAEVPTKYGARPEESPSKLRTYRDGFRILFTIIGLMSTERPRLLFGTAAVLLVLLSFGLAVPVFYDFFMTGEVKRFPTAFLCMGLVLLAVQVAAFGFLIHSIRRGRLDTKRLAYLAQKGHPRKKWNKPATA